MGSRSATNAGGSAEELPGSRYSHVIIDLPNLGPDSAPALCEGRIVAREERQPTRRGSRIGGFQVAPKTGSSREAVRIWESRPSVYGRRTWPWLSCRWQRLELQVIDRDVVPTCSRAAGSAGGLQVDDCRCGGIDRGRQRCSIACCCNLCDKTSIRHPPQRDLC
jgi:hypothetical protein